MRSRRTRCCNADQGAVGADRGRGRGSGLRVRWVIGQLGGRIVNRRVEVQMPADRSGGRSKENPNLTR
jgi:hypothetical protein